MDNSILKIILIFLVVLGVCLYLYTAMQNKDDVKVSFLGDERKLSKRSLILICFLDGLILGILVGYLLFSGAL